jgi:hypothetical protein
MACHAPQSPSEKCHFPQLEIKGNVSALRHIVIVDINRYYMFCRQGLFQAVLGQFQAHQFID